MDTPAHIRDYQDLLRNTDLLDNWSLSMNLRDRQSVLAFQEVLDEIQSRLDRLRAIALLSSIPELVQARHQDQAPFQYFQPLGRTLPLDTRKESPILSLDHLSPPVSPQPDLDTRYTQVGLSFRDALAAIQLRLDYLRENTFLRGIHLLVQAAPEAQVPLQPLSLPPTLNTWEKSPGRPSPVVSKDEIVIQRDRKGPPITRSPDIDLKGISQPTLLIVCSPRSPRAVSFHKKPT